MRIPGKAIIVFCFLIALMDAASAQSPQREKVAEGQYVTLKNGQSVAGSTQSWILWRDPQGTFELEDHFEGGNLAAQMLAAIGPKHLSVELRRKLEEETTQREVDAKLSADRQIQLLKVKGNRVLDGKPVEIVNCEAGDFETRCKGKDANAKLKTKDRHEFFYTFPFPMLLSSIVARGSTVVGQSTTTKFVVMTLGKKGPELVDSDAQLKYLGEEPLQIASSRFVVGRYSLEVFPKGEVPLKLTLWSSPKGLIFAMELESIPGERVQLVQYKKYSDF